MRGWKTAQRIVDPSVTFERSKEILQEQGFQLRVSNPSHAIFKSEGTKSPWTSVAPEGDDVPVEVAVAEGHNGLHLQLRYDTFVLFDTGDLDRFADDLAELLSGKTD